MRDPAYAPPPEPFPPPSDSRPDPLGRDSPPRLGDGLGAGRDSLRLGLGDGRGSLTLLGAAVGGAELPLFGLLVPVRAPPDDFPVSADGAREELVWVLVM